MESNFIIIILLIIVIILYIIDMYNRETFKQFMNQDTNSMYGTVNYNTMYEKCQDGSGYPLNKPCKIKTVIPKVKNVCNNKLEVIDMNNEYNSLLSINDMIDNESYSNKELKYINKIKQEKSKQLMKEIDIRSLNSMESNNNTLNDIDNELKTLNY